jgi:hypothetical protein
MIFNLNVVKMTFLRRPSFVQRNWTYAPCVEAIELVVR